MNIRKLLSATITTTIASLVALPVQAQVEVSRGQTIVTVIDGIELQIVGTVVETDPPAAPLTYSGAADNATFRFPQLLGHLRAIDVAFVTGTAGDVSSLICPEFLGACQWDAFDQIPTPNPSGCFTLFPVPDVTCRRIFTNVVSGRAPPIVEFSDAEPTVLSALDPDSLVPVGDRPTLLARVQAGFDDGAAFVPRLGGINFSTSAVVGNSGNIGLVRPTIIYVGGRDGMLHAICADDTAPCVRGVELWAYIPRTQLPLLRRNAQRIEGSPTVFDLFGDFGGGANEFKTVLIFQTGSGTPGDPEETPAVIALDITDPLEPAILWERVLGGVGASVASAPADTGFGGQQHLTFITTNLGATPGLRLEVVNTFTGDTTGVNSDPALLAPSAPPYYYNIVYSDARGTGNPLPPAEGIPAGPTLVDQTGQQLVDTVLVPSLYGELWLFEAGSGNIPDTYNGGTDAPLFRFTEDFLPVGAPAAVFSDGASLFALIASGGFRVDDPPGVASWSNSTQHFAVAIPLSEVPLSGPFDETALPPGAFKQDLEPGTRAFAQPSVVGGGLLILTDSEDINSASYGSTSDSGRVTWIDIDSKASGYIVVASGAASLDYSSVTDKAYLGGKGKIQDLALPAFDTPGKAVGLAATARGVRRMWLKAE